MKKFGTFSGVFVPSFEAILGAVLFLILPMLVGGMGLSNMLIIVLLANTATLATAFSISDCTTNLENIGAGGMFAIAKRSLGRAFGGSIGIQLFLAQAASIGFYAIGFADPLQSIASKFPLWAEFAAANGLTILQQKQVIATGIALIAFIAGLVGADFIVKIQMIIFVILSISVVSILVSPFLGLQINGADFFTSSANLSGTGLALGFWGAFATFFPAVTGIDAGVGMSGSLKNPKKSLGKGTFIAIGVTTVVYVAITFVFSYIDPEILQIKNGQTPTAIDIFSSFPVISYILLAGILFATGSSALSYFMTSPRTAQALTKDKLLPKFLSFLEKDFKANGTEPRWATVVTFLIVVPVIWAGDVTVASLVVGVCFLVVYGWINLAAFFERISGNPSFRPTSKGHWMISLYGFIICMVVIALFNLAVGIAIIASQILIFSLLLKYKSNNKLEGVWWGVYFSLLNRGFKRMKIIIQGTKNWRPIVGIFGFVDDKEYCDHMLQMGNNISDYQGLAMINFLKPAKLSGDFSDFFKSGKVIESKNDSFDDNIVAISQASYPGNLNINTVMLPVDKRINHVAMIESLVSMGKNVLLYNHGKTSVYAEERIDIWWKDEMNGNLMALLSYIIRQSEVKRKETKTAVRMIRKLKEGEDPDEVRVYMQKLITGARLDDELLILNNDDKSVTESISQISKDAKLILVGMPGGDVGDIGKIFSLDKVFFTRDLKKFDNLPPILFVKAAGVMSLIE